MFSTKKGPAKTNPSATLSIWLAVASERSMAASLHQLPKMRSSMKQMALSVMTGTFPVAAKNQNRYSTVAGSAFSHPTTSTGRLRQAGAKKWVTAVRPGCCIRLKIRSAGMELVLDVMMVSVDTRPSTCSNIFCFSGMFSVAASMTRSQSEIRL